MKKILSVITPSFIMIITVIGVFLTSDKDTPASLICFLGFIAIELSCYLSKNMK